MRIAGHRKSNQSQNLVGWRGFKRLQEASRVTSVGGSCLCINFGKPEQIHRDAWRAMGHFGWQ